MSSFYEFFETNRWNVVDVMNTEPRAAELFPVDDLPLAKTSRAYLDNAYPAGIYRHQKEALKHYLAGKNVCLVTGTASGKSLVFQTAALDILAQDPNARIMAIYPMKALGNEQQDRWQNTFQSAGLEGQIGRIDGNVPPGFRVGVLERSQVIVFTPDIIHAWLFSNLNQPAVLNYLRQVRMIVVDEVHAYSGVFGSNAAFLFRRLQHIFHLLGAHPAYICASATIAHPHEHLSKLLGLDFHLVGPEFDSSPRHPLRVTLVETAGKDRFLDEVVRLLEFLTQHTSSRFIAFVDSRKQVELISSILNRLLREEKNKAENEAKEGEAARPKRGGGRGRWGKAAAAEASEEEDLEGEVTGVLQNLNVLPYRAGYEDHDRRQIQERLVDGTLNGVVSTSALELGIDIPHLDTCVLIGVPSSATSLQQRTGRIGRHGPGDVIVVNGGDVHDQVVFANPKTFFARPLSESALYLENEHIQYIHALCLARQGGEHDIVAGAAGLELNSALSSPVLWPENFFELCQIERAGASPRHLISLKLEARDRPNYTFPLRDVESQFKVERKDGPNVSSLGSLSFGQLMREAYPGAIYYYATVPYRVTRVNVKGKSVQVRREKRYTTQPQKTLPAVFPRLTQEGISSFARQGSLVFMECSLLVRESIRGVIEQRGRNESHYPYPLARELGLYQDQPYFSRNYFTTGVILSHPALSKEGVSPEVLASLLYEAFMLKIPFERQDIGSASDHFRVNRLPVIQAGEAFLVVFDQTYGSLRLSSRLLTPAVLGQVLVEAAFLAGREHITAPGIATLAEMADTVFRFPAQALSFGQKEAGGAALDDRDPDRWERIVVPGSKGLMVRTNEEFLVQRILKTPAGLSYEGTPVSMVGSGISVMPLLTDVAEIPGESQLGWYEIETGGVEPIHMEEGEAIVMEETAGSAPELDPEWLTRMLVTYLEPLSLDLLATRLPGGGTVGEERALWIAAQVDSFRTSNQLPDLLAIVLEVYRDTMAAPEEQGSSKDSSSQVD